LDPAWFAHAGYGVLRSRRPTRFGIAAKTSDKPLAIPPSLGLRCPPNEGRPARRPPTQLLSRGNLPMNKRTLATLALLSEGSGCDLDAPARPEDVTIGAIEILAARQPLRRRTRPLSTWRSTRSQDRRAGRQSCDPDEDTAGNRTGRQCRAQLLGIGKVPRLLGPTVERISPLVRSPTIRIFRSSPSTTPPASPRSATMSSAPPFPRRRHSGDAEGGPDQFASKGRVHVRDELRLPPSRATTVRPLESWHPERSSNRNFGRRTAISLPCDQDQKEGLNPDAMSSFGPCRTGLGHPLDGALIGLARNPPHGARLQFAPSSRLAGEAADGTWSHPWFIARATAQHKVRRRLSRQLSYYPDQFCGPAYDTLHICRGRSTSRRRLPDKIRRHCETTKYNGVMRPFAFNRQPRSGRYSASWCSR